MSRLLAIAATLALLALTGCGGDDDGSESDAAGGSASETGAGYSRGGSAEEKPPAGGTGTEVTTADSQFGEVLFGEEERAIYYFDKESSEESECYGACAEAWPPVLTEGDPKAGGGAQVGLLGTTERRDGTTQVTYDGHPLYYYVDDPPGVVGCHNVEEFGGLWLAVEPSGTAVQ